MDAGERFVRSGSGRQAVCEPASQADIDDDGAKPARKRANTRNAATDQSSPDCAADHDVADRANGNDGNDGAARSVGSGYGDANRFRHTHGEIHKLVQGQELTIWVGLQCSSGLIPHDA